MDLLFDARLLHRGLSGIERVQANLLRELAALPEVSRLRALVTQEFRHREMDLPKRVELTEISYTEDILSILLHQDPKQRPDVYLLSYFPDRNPRDIFLPAAAPASVVVVHDAILNRHPEYHPDLEAHAWYDQFVKLLLQGADRILCFTRSSAGEAERDLEGDPRRIDISPLAADPVMHQPLGPEEVKRRLGKLEISGDYFVALGKDYPHKEHKTLFTALARLPEHVHLVCAGSSVFPHERDDGETLEALQDRLGLTGRVRWIAGLPDDDIKAVLQGSRGLVYPSLEEGFGLPPLEAMALRVPVAAAASMSIPEVCADGALLFEPGQPAQAAAAMQSLLDGGEPVRALIERGTRRADSFSWARSAQGVLESCLNAKRSVAAEGKASPPLQELLDVVIRSPFGDPADLESCRNEWRRADQRCQELQAEVEHLYRTVDQIRRLIPRWSLKRRLDKIMRVLRRR